MMICVCRKARFAPAAQAAFLSLAAGTLVALLASMLAPALAAPKLDFKLIHQAAMIANQAYEGQSEILGQYPAKAAWVSTPGDTNVQYVLLENPKRKIQAIAVRGTVDEVNWDLDMDTRGVRDEKSGVLMHSGFRKAAAIIYKDVKPRLKRDYQIYLTGHSLGGAVAAIVGTYLVDDKYKVAGIITFGQPRFTNVAGAKTYQNLPLLRVINQNDVVSALPDKLKGGAQQYAHVGAVINLLSGPYYIYADAKQVVEISPGTLGRYFTQISVPDHYMRWYVRNLQGKLDGTVEVGMADRNKYIVRLKPGKAAASGPDTKVQYNFSSSK